jgi:hypothetical protein
VVAFPVVADIIVCNGIIITGVADVYAVQSVVADIIASNGIIAGRPEVDAFIIVVADIIVCNGIIVRIVDFDAAIVVADIIARNGIIVAPRPEVDAATAAEGAFTIAAGIVAGNSVAAGIEEVDALTVVVTDSII